MHVDQIKVRELEWSEFETQMCADGIDGRIYAAVMDSPVRWHACIQDGSQPMGRLDELNYPTAQQAMAKCQQFHRETVLEYIDISNLEK